MASVVVYDPGNAVVANKVILYLPSANTPDYIGNPNTLINQDLSAVAAVPQRYWKYDGISDIVEMSQGEKDTIDAPPEVLNIETIGNYHTIGLSDPFSTTSNTPTSYLSLVTPVESPAGEKYRFTYNTEFSNNRSRAIVKCSLKLDGVEIAQKIFRFNSSQEIQTFSGTIKSVNLTMGSHTLELETNRVNSRGTITINRAGLEVLNYG